MRPHVHRFPENPIITPNDVPPSIDGWEVICAFNAGVIERDGEVLMLMRVAERPVCADVCKVLVPVLGCSLGTPEIEILEFDRNCSDIDFSDPRVIEHPDGIYLTSISHLRLARSADGRNFTVEPTPALAPDQPYEAFGLEDPRITHIDGTYYVVYKAVSPTGITQCLASTRDFVNWEKHGIILCPENMDGILFPAKVRGKYVTLHRPHPKFIGKPNMWIAYSPDLIHWGEHKLMMSCSKDTWEGGRLGGGAVPFMTDKGWVEIYHAATPGDRYCLGAVLMDADYPERVIAKSPEPIMEPEADYEAHGFKGGVVFTCGAIVRGDVVTVYYGAADESMAAADISVSEILDSLEPV